MSHVNGAIDRKHVQIIYPKNNGNLYETTRDFLALFYQLSVTLITALYCSFVGQYGSNNDSGVLIQSNMGGHFEDHSNNITQPESDEGVILALYSISQWRTKYYRLRLGQCDHTQVNQQSRKEFLITIFQGQEESLKLFRHFSCNMEDIFDYYKSNCSKC